MTTQAFHELLCDLNPYVDEIVGADAFHRFTDLPLELRHTVYDQYFFDETRRSVACNRWPDRHGEARIKLKTPRGKRWEKSAPFLLLDQQDFWNRGYIFVGGLRDVRDRYNRCSLSHPKQAKHFARPR
jgi:hypothetical protein